MSVLHKTMVWLGLVDDDEYYGEDDEYYADEYGEPIAAPARQPARVAAGAGANAPPAAEPSPLTVIRSRRDRDEAAAALAPVAAPRSSAVKPIPMPATRVHVMDPKGFNDAQEVGDRLKKRSARHLEPARGRSRSTTAAHRFRQRSRIRAQRHDVEGGRSGLPSHAVERRGLR